MDSSLDISWWPRSIKNSEMKKLFLTIVLFLSPLVASAEAINSFVTTIETNGSDSYIVTETIEYDFGEEYRHGIFRDIDLVHPQGGSNFLKDRFIELELLSITINGTSVKYEESSSRSTWSARIGDSELDITGVKTYEIKYLLRGPLFFLDDGPSATFYWNVTGNGWEVPINEARAIFIDTEGQRLSDAYCYFGPLGADDSCAVITSSTTTEFGPVTLAPGEGLTIAQAIDPESVELVVLERWAYVWFLLFALLILIPGSIFYIYRYHTVNRTRRTIIAQYEPYDNFKPTYAGTLFDGRLDPQDITAGIVYLAEQGFLKIKKTEQKVLFVFEVDDYEVELLRNTSEINDKFLADIITILFDKNASVGSRISLSELKKDHSRKISNITTLVKLQKDITEQMRQDGFFETNKNYKTPLIASLLLLIVTIPLFFIGGVIWFFLALLSGLFIIIILIAIYRRRTKKGHEVLDHLKGFKLFLSVTDKERFAFHNAPEKSPEQFMKYLPYAIAFKVEKEWAKVFEDITIPNPSWYSDHSGASFSAVQMTTSLGAFSTAFASSSGASASSGGGSSGGGAGGGGGGSW